MRTAIVYASYHHHNTEQLAKAMAPVFDATLYPILASDHMPDADDYDLLAIGSGIYLWRFHEKIQAFVDSLPEGNNKPVFLFSTSAFMNRSFKAKVEQTLKDKGYRVLGHYQCKGSADFLPKWLLSSRVEGGKSQGRPNEEEILSAVSFAREIKHMLESTQS